MTVLVSPPRDELDDATLVVHMGAGAVDSVTSAAVRNYCQYSSFRPPGLLTVSVFAAEGGVTVQEIVDAMPHGKFGTTSVRHVLNQGFEMIKTYIKGAPLEARLMEVHYDIILDIGTWLPSIVDGQPSEEAVESVEHLIRDEADDWWLCSSHGRSAKMATTMKTAVRSIPVDYSVIGIPHPGLRVSIRTLRADRVDLARGDIVALTGDTVSDYYARVVNVREDDPVVEIEFI